MPHSDGPMWKYVVATVWILVLDDGVVALTRDLNLVEWGVAAFAASRTI